MKYDYLSVRGDRVANKTIRCLYYRELEGVRLVLEKLRPMAHLGVLTGSNLQMVFLLFFSVKKPKRGK